jgi:hypothetical protein
MDVSGRSSARAVHLNTAWFLADLLRGPGISGAHVKRLIFAMIAAVLTLSACAGEGGGSQAEDDSWNGSGVQETEQVPVQETEQAEAPSSPLSSGGGGSTGLFVAQARGAGGYGWPFQSDANLVALGRQACELVQQGTGRGQLVGALLASDSGASEQEVVDLVNASRLLC